MKTSQWKHNQSKIQTFFLLLLQYFMLCINICKKKMITIVGTFIKWCFSEHNRNLKRHSHRNNEKRATRSWRFNEKIHHYLKNQAHLTGNMIIMTQRRRILSRWSNLQPPCRSQVYLDGVIASHMGNCNTLYRSVLLALTKIHLNCTRKREMKKTTYIKCSCSRLEPIKKQKCTKEQKGYKNWPDQQRAMKWRM